MDEYGPGLYRSLVFVAGYFPYLENTSGSLFGTRQIKMNFWSQMDHA